SAEDNNKTYDCPRDGGSGVDYIYATPEVQIDWTKRLNGTSDSRGAAASDHDVVYAHVIVPSSAAAGGTINVATFNIYHSNQQSESYWSQRLERTSTVIKNNHLAVVGLQEARQDQQRKMMTGDYLGKLYDKFPVGEERPDFSPNAVLYSKDYTLVEGKKFPIEYDNGKDVNAMVQVLLQDKHGGKFYFISTHDPANVRPGSEATNNQSRIDNAKFYVSHLNELKKDGYPIFLVGDFNSRYGTGPNDPNCIITKGGVVRDSWEIYKNITGCASGRPLGNEIDKVFMSNDMGVSNMWIAKRGKLDGNGSDAHDTIMVTAIFPGTNDTKTTARSSDIAGVRNFRDAAASSNVLKKGVLYRSGQLSALTPKGADALSSLLGNNGTIIDVRTASQRSGNKDENVAGSKNISIPIDGILDQEPMVTDPKRRTQIAKALRAAANADGPVLIHCVSGKDRTGWLVAMIMYANGATNAQVMDEYMLSKEAFPTGVKQAWLNSGISAARDKYGSIDGYLKKGLGLSDKDLQKLRQKFGA
ncbi:tyrosine-protein phosphatase, partial [Candidatus Saccharibacteria bacterium]|nr:tyrosine-protein phosphatase [Candidatus Saccharibacteria bacterium]